MISALIFAVSTAAFLQFFAGYCRSLVAAAAVQPISDQLREAAGIYEGVISGKQFGQLLELARLCPESGNDERAIAAIQLYFRLLNACKATFLKAVPDSIAWADRELARCAHFAAISLDRRITYSRVLLATQTTNHL
jgi:hypothetical protein